jgi:CMP-N-acetylneuraminic acid synthetase
MILGLVCARAGSQGIPGKNLLELDGRSLLQIAILKAIESRHIDAVVVNTDIDIEELAAEHADRPTKMVLWAPRLPEHAGSRVSKWPVYRDSLLAFESVTETEVRAVVDIDVSRPLTTPADVDATLEAWVRSEAAVTLAVGHAGKSPYFDIYEYDMAGNLQLAKEPPGVLTARQDGPPCWYHGGILVVDRNTVLGCDGMWDVPVDGHEIDAARCHDIDEWNDWLAVRAIYAEGAPA